MRNQWRFLLRYNQFHTLLSQSNISRHFSHLQVTSNPTFLPHLPSFTPSFTPHLKPFFLHQFSTISENSTDPFALINIFTKPINGDEIGKELSEIHAVFTPGVVTDVLKNLNNDPKTAIKFFDWVKEKENKSLSCKGYNFMLGVLGSNGLFKEFWDLYDVMVKRGFGVRKGTYEKVVEKFEKEGSQFDVERLKNLYSKDVKKIEIECDRVSNLVEGKVWDKSVEEEVKGLGVSYTSELVKMLLEKFKDVPIKKGLRFFRWVEESGSFVHDQGTYNAMAVVLSGGNDFSRFWNLLGEMRRVGFELEMETYRQVTKRFVEKKSVEDAVRLYEYAMDGANKPSREDFIYLVKDVDVSKELGLKLFSRVVKRFSESGLFEHDQGTYNAMAVALDRLDGFNNLCNLVNDMRWFELDMETYRQVCKRFIKNKKVEDAVKLYEYAMNWSNKPSREDFILLVKEVSVAKELGMELFSRVVKKFSESGLFEHDQGTYNAMAVALGRLDCFDKFWNLVDELRNAGFELEMETCRWVSVRFFKNKMVEDADRLYDYVMNGANKPSREDFIFLVKMVVNAKELGMEFFSRVVKKFSESGLFEHDQETYNAMAVALGRLECFDRFWNLVDDMRNAGFELEKETYSKVSKRFIRNMMLEDAVRLYEYAMDQTSKPSLNKCIRLLEKVVAAEELDMELFSRVIKISVEYVNAMDELMLDSVHESLKSAGRMFMYIEVLDAMVECGYKPSELKLCSVALDVSSTGMKDEAREVIDKTREYFEIIIKREGFRFSLYTVIALDFLVNAYCNTERTAEAFRIVNDLVNKEHIKPQYDTYTTLISMLLTQNGFQEAINIIGFMRKHEYPLFLDPFIAYLAKGGTTDEAMTFFKAITVKTFPSTNVVLRLFEAYLEAGKHEEAHNVLARCPQYIRNNAAVLNLFYSLKPETEPVAVAAA